MSSDTAETDLAAFQFALLDQLAGAPDADSVRKALLAREDLLAFHDYISTWEDRMIDVARELVKKWGARENT